MDSTANTIVVEDLTGELFEALGPEGRPIAGFVIFAFNDSKQANAPTYQTHGTWTSAPSFASNQTTFTDADADDNGGGFASWMIGAILVPDVNIGAPLIITGTTATTLTVAGDARGVAANGTRYIVYAAPFVNPAHGAWQTDPHKGGTRYLWAGYRYQPPQMGFWVDPPGAPALGVYGASTGTNRLGQYYCWNRTYDINTGRWTTPDPVAMPWCNLCGYVNEGPIAQSDHSGLSHGPPFIHQVMVLFNKLFAACQLGTKDACAEKSAYERTFCCTDIAWGLANAIVTTIQSTIAEMGIDTFGWGANAKKTASKIGGSKNALACGDWAAIVDQAAKTYIGKRGDSDVCECAWPRSVKRARRPCGETSNWLKWVPGFWGLHFVPDSTHWFSHMWAEVHWGAKDDSEESRDKEEKGLGVPLDPWEDGWCKGTHS